MRDQDEMIADVVARSLRFSDAVEAADEARRVVAYAAARVVEDWSCPVRRDVLESAIARWKAAEHAIGSV